MSKFGLTLRKKEDQKTDDQKPKTAAIFNQDSDEEEADQSAAVKFQRKYAGQEKSKDKKLVEKIMAENPDIYDYDGQYEKMQQLRDQKIVEQKEADKEKKPKYAHKIVEAHKKRELEKLLHDERTYKKEREEEAGQFDDKEVFISGAYRQQIEDRNKFRIELEQQDRMDEMRDVKKQGMWQQAFQRKMLENRARVTEEVMDNDGDTTTTIKTELKMEINEQKEEVGEEMKPKVKKEMHSRKEIKEEEEVEQEEGPERKRQRKEHQEEKKRERRRADDGKEERIRERRGRRNSSRSESPPPPRERRRSRERRRRSRSKTPSPPATEIMHEKQLQRERADSVGSSRSTTNTTAEGKPVAARPKTTAIQMPVMDDLTEEVRRMEIIRQILRKRNDAKAIEEARQRYRERREMGQIIPPFVRSE